MARTVGRVNILVDFDGNALPEKARAMAERAGDRAGQGFNERFAVRFSRLAQELLPEMDRTGRLSGHRISTAMEREIESRLDGIASRVARAFLTPSSLDEFAKDFDRVDHAVERLRHDLEILHDSGNLNDEAWNRFGGTLNQWAGKARAAEREADRLAESIKKVGTETENTHRKTVDFDRSGGFRWKSLSHGLRQVLLIGGAIVAGGEQLSTMASALSSILVGVLSSAIVGVTGSAVALSTVLPNLAYGIALAGRSLEIFEERGGPAAESMNRLSEAFKTVDANAFADEWEEAFTRFNNALATSLEDDRIGEMTGKAFAKITDAFTNVIESDAWATFRTEMETTLPDALTAFGTGVATLAEGILTAFTVAAPYALELAEGFNRWAAEWTDHIKAVAQDGTLDAFFRLSLDSLNALVNAISPYKDALWEIFIIGAPYGNEMLGILQEIGEQFRDFVNSEEGRKSISEWFENGLRLLPHFNDLLGRAGQVLGSLVTPETVENTARFLDSVGRIMPFIEDLLQFFGDLDLFGRAGIALETFGNAIGPLMSVLGPMLDIFLDIVDVLTLGLTPAFLLAQPFLEIMRVAFEAVSYVVDAVTNRLKDLMIGLEPVREALSDAADRIFTALQPALDGLIQKILELLPSPEELARIIENEVIPAIDNFANWIITEAVPAIEDMIEWIGDLIVWLHDDLPKTLQDIENWVEGAKLAFEAFVRFMAGPIGVVWNLVDAINTLNNTPVTNTGGGGGGAGAPRFTAAGGIFNGAQTRIIGEAGPEAVVPLNRDLSKVDPAVRWLSAIAQGKPAPSAQGIHGGGTVVEAGAITIVGVRDEMQAASAAIDRLVALARS